MMADPPARDSDVEAFRYAVFKLFYQQGRLLTCPISYSPVIFREIAQEDKVQVDKETVFVLSELLLGYIDIFAGDLEAFCRHGKRTTITAEDVLLCCRRNDFLVSLYKTNSSRESDFFVSRKERWKSS
jgi:histone H3/H4